MPNDPTDSINGPPGPDEPFLVIGSKNQIVNIQEIWAFLSVDPSDNTEGIISYETAVGPMPMIAADAERLHLLMPYVERLVNGTRITVRLVKFSTREDIRVLEPKP